MPEVRQVFSHRRRRTARSARRRAARQDHARRTSANASLGDIKDDIRDAPRRHAAAEDDKVADPEFMQGAPTQAPINVFVRGDDMDELQRLSDEIGRAHPQRSRARSTSDSTLESRPAGDGRARQSRAAPPTWASASARVAMQLRGMVEGVVPTRLRDGDKEYDIRVRLAPEFRNDFEAIARAPLYSPTGAARPHGRHRPDGARRRPEQHRPRTAPRGRPRSASTWPGLRRSATSPPTSQRVMDGLTMPPNFEWGFAGDVELMQESARGHGAGAAAGGRLHLHRAGVAVRVVPRAVPHHALAAARARRRAAAMLLARARTSACPP